MARTKQTARKSTGGKAPRKQLAASTSGSLRNYMTSQQIVGQATRADGRRPDKASYLNHENVIGSFAFEHQRTDKAFVPQASVCTVPNLQTGLPESWLSLQWMSKYDGDGFTAHPRPSLSLVIVLDISGSMGCSLEDDPFAFGSVYQPMPMGKSKLDAAKRCLLAILGQLQPTDSVGVVLFNHETHLLHAPSAATEANKAAITDKLQHVRPGGGTRLEHGFTEGMKCLDEAVGDQVLHRVYFLTDMQSDVLDEAAVLRHAKARAERGRHAPALHTTVVGMGVDLSVGTVEALSSLPGGKYASVSTAAEFERAVGTEFSHDVMPIAFDIRVALADGWSIERVCGSAELNALAPGSTELRVSSEFASPHDAHGMASGGVLMLKLRPPASSVSPVFSAGARRVTRRSAAAPSSAAAEGLCLTLTWMTPEGKAGACNVRLSVPALGPTSRIESAALRKGLALVRFVDLQKSFCDASDEADIEGRRARLRGYSEGRNVLLAECRALGDDTLLEGGANHAFLETLDQIIRLETKELDQLEQGKAAAARQQPAAAAGSVQRKRQRRSIKEEM